MPEWMLSAASWRRHYRVAWTRVCRYAQSLREVPPRRRTAAPVAWLGSKESLLSCSRLTLGFQAELPGDSFFVYLQSAPDRPFERKTNLGPDDPKRRCRCALLTWNGVFGCISGVDASGDIEVMVKRLRLDSGAQGLSRVFQAWFTEGIQRSGVEVFWALCAEVCLPCAATPMAALARLRAPLASPRH